MNEVTQNKFNKINFSGINNLQNAKQLDELLANALKKLCANSDRITEFGECPIIFEKFKNPVNNGASDYVLSISKPPAGVENHESMRLLELAAYRIPNSYKAIRTIAAGTKEELINIMKSPEILEKLKSAAKSLPDSLRSN